MGIGPKDKEKIWGRRTLYVEAGGLQWQGLASFLGETTINRPMHLSLVGAVPHESKLCLDSKSSFFHRTFDFHLHPLT